MAGINENWSLSKFIHLFIQLKPNMGAGSFKVPPQVESMPKNSKAVTFKVEYCGSWGGRPEADYVAQLLKIVYPNAKVEIFTPGHTANLIVQVNGKEFYNRKTRSDEKVREETAVKFLEKVAAAVANEKWSGNEENGSGQKWRSNESCRGNDCPCWLD